MLYNEDRVWHQHVMVTPSVCLSVHRTRRRTAFHSDSADITLMTNVHGGRSDQLQLVNVCFCETSCDSSRMLLKGAHEKLFPHAKLTLITSNEVDSSDNFWDICWIGAAAPSEVEVSGSCSRVMGKHEMDRRVGVCSTVDVILHCYGSDPPVHLQVSPMLMSFG